ncbi:polysaccharide biosynthesis tyrosine autokinase [Flavobacterium sp. SUN052]|uniref:polysaccharide biosynthesis tyrosine autokinase n=1 Tax=Flavobacterium sp. SUN052 TaxID=3002441 RepID=UPI00237D423C|nr:tyrosine-protein kinase family protein [Flavobacterium sp. SUN052]MEC4005498.1 polysaccharide biosynthesis tyrosine autokinase [Flavobacterium sp. SUN052]
MESKEIQINIKDEIFKYLLYWKWIVLSVLLSFLICYFYLRYSSNVYQTSAKIQILDHDNAAFKLPTEGISIFGTSKANLENEIEIIKSSRILSNVVDSLNLSTEIYSVGKIKSLELWDNAPFRVIWAVEKDSLRKKSIAFKIVISNNGYRIDGNTKEYKFGQTNFDLDIPFRLDKKNNFFFKKNVDNSYSIILKQKEYVNQEIANNIKIDNVGNQSNILKITLNGKNVNKINDIINTLIGVFNQDGIKDRQLVFKKTIEFVDDRFKSLSSQLDSIENSKASYKIANELSYVEADAGQLMKNNYESQIQVENATTQIELSKLMTSSINKSKSFELLPSNIGIESNEINSLVGSYNDIILRRNKLLASGGRESNPIVNEISSQALQLKNNIKASIIGYQNSLATKKSEVGRISSLERSKYSKVPSNEKVVRSIERQQSIKETLYILLLQKREEAAVNLAITNPSVKIVDYAINSLQPIEPKRSSIYLTALLIGLLLPLLFIYLYYLSENKIQNKEEIETQIPSIPVIAEIPFIEAENKTIRAIDRSILSESFRILRTNLNFIIANKTSEGNVLFVTSTIKSEGKTFVSFNIAITFASLAKKVIIIGADLRNPQLHNYLKIDRLSNSKGVSNFLYDTTLSIDDIKMSCPNVGSNLNVDIILSGTIPPNPAELLSNGRFEYLLNELKKEYDYVIVDTAPMLLVTDTSLISHLADVVLYIIRANFTQKKLLKFVDSVRKLNTKNNISIILNNVGQNKSYGYGYSYNYGYGYGYENDYNRTTTLQHKLKKIFRNLFRKVK